MSSPQPLHDALDKFRADTGIDIDMHIDALPAVASAPFVAPDIVSGLPACRV